MTKQRKSEKNREIAKQFTLLHKQGQKGPKSTKPVHGKDPANRLYTASKRGMKDGVKPRSKQS